jgi:hypothetical protein
MQQSDKATNASTGRSSITVREVIFDEMYENCTIGQLLTSLARNRMVFKYAQILCKDYQGDTWQSWQLSNGGWFLTPKTQQNYHVCVPGNAFEGTLSAEVFGITVSLFAQGEISWTTERDVDSDAYYALRDFALDHAEAAAILAAID